jgi:hypothetical protein
MLYEEALCDFSIFKKEKDLILTLENVFYIIEEIL